MQEPTTARPEIPVACSLTDAEMSERGEALSALFSAAQETIELPRGYALRFASDPALTSALVEAILKERECCPFFEFKLEFEPANGPLWLHIEGPEGTKALISPALPNH
jgi:hypothetical protein